MTEGSPQKFLTTDEIRELTGKTRYSAQAKWLRERGYKIDQRDDGSVILLLEEMNAKLLSSPAKAGKFKRDWRPDLSVLDRAS